MSVLCRLIQATAAQSVPVDSVMAGGGGRGTCSGWTVVYTPPQHPGTPVATAVEPYIYSVVFRPLERRHSTCVALYLSTMVGVPPVRRSGFREAYRLARTCRFTYPRSKKLTSFNRNASPFRPRPLPWVSLHFSGVVPGEGRGGRRGVKNNCGVGMPLVDQLVQFVSR